MVELMTAFLLYNYHASYLWWIGYILVFLIETIQDINYKYGEDDGA
jgi:hypothetical protein